MSMLTPPGMGRKYRVTGTVYPRMRRPPRRRRLLLAALAAVLVLGLGGWGTVQLVDLFAGDGSRTVRAAAPAACEPKKPAAPVRPAVALPPPGQITVNVYNATPRAGLAKATADELKKRGFAIGKVGNAPVALDKKVPGTGLLLGGTEAVQGAFPVLGTQLKGALTRTDTRPTADVDLVIGTAFQALTPPKDATVALTALTRPKPLPEPSGC
ncbi:LytR C-terminal domain-containing protein [Streptomyces sp. LP05-1]|uniref:LytR C-terminal domain-containing protein n=1 Tax=Streptomyces pyxinae TaxID=2970734 RepID=A0ABT2CCF4_9ACTN|nr:LytR C-terminal domain-containing protein [Streptomyces sp. LP05-1]MCS0635094.1 LytR C-terminal domain-containing protein [Streptomyces sp. LP05-1]